MATPDQLRRIHIPEPRPGAKALHHSRFVVFYDDGGQRVCDTASDAYVWMALDSEEPDLETIHDAHSELMPEDTSALAQAIRKRVSGAL